MIDASSRAELLGLLHDFQVARGVSYLFITHDLASARHFADRVAVMYLGRIVELADARELIDHPMHPYARALLDAVPEPDPGQPACASGRSSAASRRASWRRRPAVRSIPAVRSPSGAPARWWIRRSSS